LPRNIIFSVFTVSCFTTVIWNSLSYQIKKFHSLLLSLFWRNLPAGISGSIRTWASSDEFLHLDQAEHFSMGLPLCAHWLLDLMLIFWLGIDVLGFGFPALVWVFTLYVWSWGFLVGRLGGNAIAKSISRSGHALLPTHSIEYPLPAISVDILCSHLYFYTLIRYIQSGKDRWCICFGVSLLRAFFKQIHHCFPAIGHFLLWFLTRPSIFQNIIIFYGALKPALAVVPSNSWFLAISKWDFQYCTHMRFIRVVPSLVNNSRVGFLMDQLLFFLSSAIYSLAGRTGKCIYFWKEEFQELSLCPGWLFLITLRVFLLFSGQLLMRWSVPGCCWFLARLALRTFVDLNLSIGALPNHSLLLFPPLNFSCLLYPWFTPFIPLKKWWKILPDYVNFGLNRWEDRKEHPIPTGLLPTMLAERNATGRFAYQLMPRRKR